MTKKELELQVKELNRDKKQIENLNLKYEQLLRKWIITSKILSNVINTIIDDTE